MIGYKGHGFKWREVWYNGRHYTIDKTTLEVGLFPNSTDKWTGGVAIW